MFLAVRAGQSLQEFWASDPAGRHAPGPLRLPPDPGTLNHDHLACRRRPGHRDHSRRLRPVRQGSSGTGPPAGFPASPWFSLTMRAARNTSCPPIWIRCSPGSPARSSRSCSASTRARTLPRSTASTGSSSGAARRRATWRACCRPRAPSAARSPTGVPYHGILRRRDGGAGAGDRGRLPVHGTEVCPEDCSEGLEEVEIRDGLGLVPFAVDVHAAQAGTLGRAVGRGRARPSWTGASPSMRTPPWSCTTRTWRSWR